jgi:hypothetical protein
MAVLIAEITFLTMFLSLTIGQKKIDVVYRVLRNYGPEAAWKEVAKCDVVCANCHKIRTYQREQENES